FWSAVRAYLKKHARSIVETRDLMRALEEVSGRGLEQFFEQWVYRPGHPDLEVKVEYEGGVLNIGIKQTQKIDKDAPCFAFTLVFDVVPEKGKATRHTHRIEKPAETIALPCPERPSFVVVDPDLAVLADVKLEAPFDMLERQLADAPTARGRWLAAQPLGKRGDTPSLAALGRALARESEFWGVRSEAAQALGR